MTIFLQDPDVTLWHGEVLETLRELPAESVDCVITSPPYWGLRDYGTGSWEGGDPDCDHRRGRDNNAPMMGHRNETERLFRSSDRYLNQGDAPFDEAVRDASGDSGIAYTVVGSYDVKTGWTDCGHNAYRPGRVLDPFMGSGTTAFVARKHGRHAVGIDLNADYLKLAARRLQQQSLFAASHASTCPSAGSSRPRRRGRC